MRQLTAAGMVLLVVLTANAQYGVPLMDYPGLKSRVDDIIVNGIDTGFGVIQPISMPVQMLEGDPATSMTNWLEVAHWMRDTAETCSAIADQVKEGCDSFDNREDDVHEEFYFNKVWYYDHGPGTRAFISKAREEIEHFKQDSVQLLNWYVDNIQPIDQPGAQIPNDDILIQLMEHDDFTTMYEIAMTLASYMESIEPPHDPMCGNENLRDSMEALEAADGILKTYEPPSMWEP